jgi:hypothetical protein
MEPDRPGLQKKKKIRKGKPAYHRAWAGRHPLSKNHNKTFPPAGAAGYMLWPPLRTYSSESVIAPDPKFHPMTHIRHTLRCGKGFMCQWLHDTPAAFWRAPSTKAENSSSSARGVVAAGSPPPAPTVKRKSLTDRWHLMGQASSSGICLHSAYFRTHSS